MERRCTRNSSNATEEEGGRLFLGSNTTARGAAAPLQTVLDDMSKMHMYYITTAVYWRGSHGLRHVKKKPYTQCYQIGLGHDLKYW